jgi:hypothetical protein
MSHAEHAAHHVHHVARAHHGSTQTYRPTNKTIGATVGSAASGVLVYFVNHFWPGTITPECASLLTVLATFGVGYLVPHGAREAIAATNHRRRAAVA